MSTNIRAELSQKNPYWIERHRYYELKHFCLQYSIWKRALVILDTDLKAFCISEPINNPSVSKPVEELALKRLYFKNRIDMVDRASSEADSSLSNYILEAVTKGLSYDTLKSLYSIPCCKDTYYNVYRRFFWLLDKARA